MPLRAGVRLGPYEIVSRLGAGGMGEVYRARDVRLGRDVALKVLPPEVAGDPDRRARFEREARLTGSLNAPGIVTLFDIGEEDGVAFSVSELIEGRTVREVLAEGPVPLRKALDWAAQIAEALAAAHRAGVVHRDLKPENVMVTAEGRAKVLDFGLARPLAVNAAVGDAASPTVSLTREHTIVGTLGYMSPEQVRGAAVDHRSDIFSFGALLYEMLAGRPAFLSDTAAETMAAILKTEPEELAPPIPAPVRDMVRRCVEKEPQARFDSAGDLAFALRAVSMAAVSGLALPPVTRPRRRLRAAVALAVLLAAGAAGGFWLARDDGGANAELRFTPVATDPATESFPAFSPDGKSVAYTRSPGAIYVRALDSAVPTHVNAGLPPGTHPFWAPDGSRVYYSSERTLHSVSSAGGALAKVMDDCRGAALTPDGKALLFARRENGRLIWYTSSPPGAEPKKLRDDLPEVEELGRGNAGFSPDGSKFAILDKTLQGWTVPYPSGTPRRIPGAESGRFLAWFPDSRHMLIHMASNGEGFRLAVVDTKTGARRLVYEGPDPAIAGSVSPDGVRVAYAAGPADLDVIEFGLDGKRLRVLANSSRLDSDADWSPRGDQLVYASGALGGRDLWIRSGDGLRATRLTAGTAGDPIGPRFSPDGRRIAYCSGLALWVMPAEGGRPVSVYSGGARMYSPAWSRDGDWLVVGDRSRLMKVPAGGGKAVPLKQVNMGGHSGVRWSRDGRWIAYFQPGEGLHLVSVDGRQERLLARGPGVTPGGDFTPGSASYVLARRGEDRDWELVVVDVASGRELKSAPLEIDRDDGIWTLSCHPDGRRVAITTGRLRYDIWMIEGFPQPARGWMRLLRHWTQ